eukprot:2472458-Pyramimonas_sp.AAC.1
MQGDLHRSSFREQAFGTWVGEIAPWATLLKRGATCAQVKEQCSTGLRDSWHSSGILQRCWPIIMQFSNPSKTKGALAIMNWRRRPSALQSCNR